MRMIAGRKLRAFFGLFKISQYFYALGGHEKALEPDHVSTLGAVHNIGVLYSKQDKLGEADR
ncbi:unnamed protein product [Penicillium roqueforti FM164]|uniref:Uncharacterized protein n=1 Tax=Penicillium roqueforti (strain FM164) TaxID=1365484 RepID=W6QTF4_PENRF|nr:unnamed protein product [Penicillium roqueforti FM164]